MKINRKFELSESESKNLKIILDAFGVKFPEISSGQDEMEVPEEVLEVAAAAATLVPAVKRLFQAFTEQVPSSSVQLKGADGGVIFDSEASGGVEPGTEYEHFTFRPEDCFKDDAEEEDILGFRA